MCFQSIENSFVEYRKVNSMKLEKERQRKEFGEKLKKTENEFHNKFEQQREKYDNIVEQQVLSLFVFLIATINVFAAICYFGGAESTK